MGNMLPYPLDGSFTPHPNSLMMNVFPIFYPAKVYWTGRKVCKIDNYLMQNLQLICNCSSLKWLC